MEGKRLFFIPGLGRCGTTWVTSWLGRHPAVATIGETYLVRQLYSLTVQDPAYSRIVSKDDAAAFARSIYAKVAGDRPCVLDKSPGPMVYLGTPQEDFLRELFPDCRILLFYRDGKDYVHAFQNLPWESRVQPTVASAARDWMVNASYLLKRRDREGTMTVRYEDLLSEPDAMSERITKFLGLTLHEPLVPWNEPINTVHETLEKDRWRIYLEKDREILAQMNPLLVAMGYDPFPA